MQVHARSEYIVQRLLHSILSDVDLEIVEVAADFAVVPGKSSKSESLGLCRSEATTSGSVQARTREKPDELLRDPHLVLCVEEGAEGDVGGADEQLKSVHSASSSEETLERTDSEFLPTDAELQTEDNITLCESEEVSFEDTENSEEEGSDGIEEQVQTLNFSSLIWHIHQCPIVFFWSRYKLYCNSFFPLGVHS